MRSTPIRLEKVGTTNARIRLDLDIEIFCAVHCGRLPLPLCGLVWAKGISGDPVLARVPQIANCPQIAN